MNLSRRLALMLSIVLSACTAAHARDADAAPLTDTGSGLECDSNHELVVLDSPMPSPLDAFGSALALSADGARAIVGAIRAETVGRAWIFARVGDAWTLEASLEPSPPTAFGDSFGGAVAITPDGSRVVVGVSGALGHSAENGYAMVYVREGATWRAEARLTTLDGVPTDYLGHAVAIDATGERVLLGAYGDVRGPSLEEGSQGSVRVFVRSGSSWTEEATLASDVPRAVFGVAIAISAAGDRALVGAPGDDFRLAPAQVHVFARVGTAWEREAILFSSRAFAGDRFGYAVSFDREGSVALIGASAFFNPDPSVTGAGVIFRRSGTTWTEEAWLEPPCSAPGAWFGASVALTGDGRVATIGAPLFDSASGANVGRVFRFERRSEGWTAGLALGASAAIAEESLGRAVAVSEDGAWCMTGAYVNDIRTTLAGRALVFGL